MIGLDRWSCKDLKGNSRQLYLLNEHDDLYFLLQISDHYFVGNNQGKFKKKSCQLLFLGNHLRLRLLAFFFFGTRIRGSRRKSTWRKKRRLDTRRSRIAGGCSVLNVESELSSALKMCLRDSFRPHPWRRNRVNVCDEYLFARRRWHCD